MCHCGSQGERCTGKACKTPIVYSMQHDISAATVVRGTVEVVNPKGTCRQSTLHRSCMQYAALVNPRNTSLYLRACVLLFAVCPVLRRAMGVLTAGSPCAVVLVPLAYVCAIATITRKGVLVRSGAALDALLSCTTVALDKTGEA